ncbi:sugar phosphate isomerase/epimerase [Spinactinospora alkalitolerans]|uniref:Sugar phosphate isomerase/epimerase n=1 Tax=Spinactinospora alkalitolerans TaxID=687207 RepID=A0A852TWC1_9ACTN|nr:metabolite traffic protein EboE [Spinactinospora alkalitolerans]NYE46374.1 sugar phosphate isomerase/epimerase [Spinactinospora alkalitolerans]
MRLRHPDGTLVHVAYCTNVHPAEDLDGVLDQVRRYGAPVRAALGLDRVGLGLWLPAPLARRLAGDPGETERLRTALERSGLEVVTLNAFPYAGFQAPVVKGRVYHPDWTERERLDYTLDCARVLGRLLPDDARRGSVSTLPLAWRAPWDAGRRRRALDNLDRLAAGLGALAAETGRPVRVGLEPEPGCVVETTGDAAELLAAVDRDHIGVCLDTCHLAVAFEEPDEALARLAAAGLPVVKTQASAAVQAPRPAGADARAALSSFAEDRFLHQVRESAADGIRARDDLPDALAGEAPLDGDGPWRVHFHVPLHRRPLAPLEGTQEHLSRTLAALFGPGAPVTDHVEVETYTWSVLPEHQRPEGDAGLVSGLAGELAWVRGRLTEIGLEDA